MFSQALQFTLRWEGGYVNDPDDPGGATYRGVTQETANQWFVETHQHWRPCSMLLQSEIEQIYHDLYWLKAGCDRLPWPLAMVVFDCAVHSGASRSIKLLQRACGAKEDGALGPITLGAAKTVDPLVVMETRRAFLRKLIIENPTLGKYRIGWMNRLDDLGRKLRGYLA